jgi:hypothetical protein
VRASFFRNKIFRQPGTRQPPTVLSTSTRTHSDSISVWLFSNGHRSDGNLNSVSAGWNVSRQINSNPLMYPMSALVAGAGILSALHLKPGSAAPERSLRHSVNDLVDGSWGRLVSSEPSRYVGPSDVFDAFAAAIQFHHLCTLEHSNLAYDLNRA